MYPLELSRYFHQVITAEPEDINFKCLQLNTLDRPDITTLKAAFLGFDGHISLQGWDKNTGCFRTVKGADIECFKIDSLNIGDCDFIQLDIEGDELEALDGAIETIKRCHPVIMVERRGHGPDPHDYLLGLGYREKLNSKTDSVYMV